MEGPPRLAAKWLARALGPGVVSESAQGDLYEEFREREARSRRLARAWYWGAAFRVGMERGLGRARSGMVNVVTDGAARGTMKMTGLWNDARFALRGLFRAPGFTAITIGTLALGIGATTAIFTVVNGVLLKPLPFENQDELVSVGHGQPSDRVPPNAALYFTYREESRVFEDIGSFLKPASVGHRFGRARATVRDVGDGRPPSAPSRSA